MGRAGGEGLAMCRVYKSKRGWYVRLCAYHGEDRGKRMPVDNGFVLPGVHYPKVKVKGRVSISIEVKSK